MNLPNAIKQRYRGPLLVPGVWSIQIEDAPPPLPLLEYKGPHASDKQTPSDIQVRVHGNMGRKTEPVSVRAEQWIAQHPDVYAMFVRFAFEVIGSGQKRIGAKAIAERIRWEAAILREGEYKVANIAVAYMAKRFSREYPEHGELFSRSKVQSKGK